ncbi:MAG: Gfo/Idh/MocA family oxidoreductase [Pirellulales bacterium]|nr:Gfo/Idh/MocA family oxidoreductase [Pirellulales bacterium]
MKKSALPAPLRFAMVGLGHFAQAAVLPAFANTKKKAELKALVTGDPEKSAELSEKYQVPAVSYDSYESLLQSGDIDAVYVAVPNTLHREYTERAARQGMHVLCEKPLAYTTADARAMITACREANVRLMTAYRLHFEEGNLQAIAAVKGGEIGEPRLFIATHTMQVKEDNIRVDAELGGGPLEDIGIYCLNAARYLFQSEPEEVFAYACFGTDPRFVEVPESVCATLRFPQNRLATFLCGFGEAKSSEYRVLGTKGLIKVDPAFTWQGDIQLSVINGQQKTRKFKHRDQIAAEIIHFVDSVRNDQDPEPSGEEGLIDVNIIEALRHSYTTNQPVKLDHSQDKCYPDPSQSIHRPPSSNPELVNASSPGQ